MPGGLEDEVELRAVRDEYLSKSQRLYITFYSLLGFSTLIAGISQLLYYEEKYYADIAEDLDVIATGLATLSTIILQILAISGIKAIGASLNRVGALMNVYLSPFVTPREKKEIAAKIRELTLDVEPFWVSLPRFSDGRHLAEILGAEEHTRIQSMLSRKGAPPAALL